MTYTDQDDGASVSLAPGDSFEVRLRENPTTGYQWDLAEWDRAILEMTRDEFRPAGVLQRGAGGEHVWEFVARTLGTLSLVLTYRRPGGSEVPANTFSLRVSVTSAAS